MTILTGAPVVAKATHRMPATVFSALWSGWADSVFVVLLAVIVVEAVPHARGKSVEQIEAK